MNATTHYTTCFLCEATCGLAIDIEDGRISRIRGDEADPFSRGYLCPKGVALQDIQHDPDRLLHPIRRTPGGWEEVGWDEALGDIAARLHAIRTEHGRDAVGFYAGNPTVHSHGAVLYSLVLLEVLKTRSYFSANSIDASPRLLASNQVFGSQALIPIPDVDRTSHLFILGANPLVSNGSLMTAPGFKQRLRDLRARGGRLVVVDPRRTETAEIADEHVFIRPGGDVYLLLGMLHTLFAEDLARPGRLAPMLDGLAELERLAGSYAPERVAPACGIPAETIRRLARDFAAAPSAVCYGRIGTCTQEFGAVTSWLVDVLNTVTGNLDREGGAMFTTPAVDLPALASMLGQQGSFDRWRSRVSNKPELNGEIPATVLAEEIETPGPGQIRALITHAANPVLSVPNGRRLDRALEKLDLLVAIDIYRNETTRHAHYILPPTFGLERDNFPLFFHSLSVRNWVKYSPAALPTPPGLRHDWEILFGLAARLLKHRGLSGRALAGTLRGLLGRGPKPLLGLLVRTGPHGRGLVRGARERLRLADIEAAPHGLDLGPLEPKLPGLLGTRPRKVRLTPKVMVDDLARVEARLGARAAETASNGHAAPLVLISRRTLRSNNSWMHNSERLVSGKNRCTLLMNPNDAAPRQLSSGERVRISSRVGAIEAELEVSAEMMPGVVCLPHGWGHALSGTALSVASRTPGVSINDVADDALEDRLSGTSQLAVPVTIERAAGTV